MSLNRDHKKEKKDYNTGFTLIEVLIAMAIFAIGFLAVGAMQVNSLNTTNSARMTTEAMTLAENQAELLRALPFYDRDADLDGVAGNDRFDEHPLLDAANNPHIFDAPGRYTVNWTIDPNRPLPMYPVTVHVSPGPVARSKFIRLWVTPDNDPARNAAELEFALFPGIIE